MAIITVGLWSSADGERPTDYLYEFQSALIPDSMISEQCDDYLNIIDLRE